jgi:hypothetical protein
MQSIYMIEDIWFKDPKSFLSYDNICNFFPVRTTPKISQLNALFRFSIYLGMLIYIYNKNEKVLFIPFITGVFTFVEYNMYYPIETFAENLKKSSTRKPTRENPFMNPNLITEKHPDSAAQDLSNKSTRDSVQKLYESHDQFLSTMVPSTDILSKGSMSHQFYTVPSTTIPSDQDSFAQFLYGNMKSRKKINVY